MITHKSLLTTRKTCFGNSYAIFSWSSRPFQANVMMRGSFPEVPAKAFGESTHNVFPRGELRAKSFGRYKQRDSKRTCQKFPEKVPKQVFGGVRAAVF